MQLLRLRTDEQLVRDFCAGHDEAFAAIYDRFYARLFTYTRQMLSNSSRQDADDVIQDVFIRAFRNLPRADPSLNLRAWLYRIAHNRCIDYLRRPVPPVVDLFEVSRRAAPDPAEEIQRREDLRQLVSNITLLPAQQKSALVMREIDGLPYADLAAALDVTVPAVKSLLVRARIGLRHSAKTMR